MLRQFIVVVNFYIQGQLATQVCLEMTIKIMRDSQTGRRGSGVYIA